MPNPLVHFQFASPDPAATREFLGALFDWDFTPGEGRIAANIDTGARQIEPNDIYPAGTIIEMPAAYAALFFRVQDLDGTVARAVSLGGRVIVPRRRTATGADVSIVESPQGHVLGIVQA